MRRLIVGVALLAGAGSAVAQPVPCPGSDDPPPFVDAYVNQAFRNWLTRSSNLPSMCLFERVAKSPWVHSDSAIEQSIILTREMAKRSPNEASIFAARVVLLNRGQQYREVEGALNEVFATDPRRITLEMQKAAVAAAFRLNDTAGIKRQLSIGAGRFPQYAAFGADLRIFEQIPRLRALIDSVHRAMAKDRSLIEGYASLASIYGNLNQLDSALAYTRLGLRRGLRPAVVGPAHESIIGVTLRRAQVLDAPDAWIETLPRARAIDSAYSTPASKYLVALALSQVVADRTRVAQEVLTGGETDAFTGLTRKRLAPGMESYIRVMSCPRLQESIEQIGESAAFLDAGGAQFDPVAATAIRKGLGQMREVLELLRPNC
jgi:hypothetical protein